MQSSETGVPPSLSGKTILVFFGMTASGKSTLGRACADFFQAAYYNTDLIRKELAGLQASDKRPDGVGRGIYTSVFTEKTYAAMLEHAKQNLSLGGKLVVLDGSYSRYADRDLLRFEAARLGVRCIFIFCSCSEGEVRRRLELRAQDPEAVSDGRWEIYLHQKQTFEMPDATLESDCLQLNTEQPVEAMLGWLAAQPCLQG
jgi:uncharacterized protein